MVYLNSLESSNQFVDAPHGRQISKTGMVFIAAQFTLAFGVMLIVAVALVAHGMWRQKFEALMTRSRRKKPGAHGQDTPYRPSSPSA